MSVREQSVGSGLAVADLNHLREQLAGRLVLRPWSEDENEPGVGQVFGIGRRQTYERIASGQIPSIRLGRRIVVPVAGLLAMLDGEDAA